MQRKTLIPLFAMLFFIPCLLTLHSCKDDDETPALDRDKFLGSYDFTNYTTTYYNGQTYYDTATGILFIEVPEASLGLGENYIVVKGLTCSSCESLATVLDNDFMFEPTSGENTTGTGTTTDSGETLSIDYLYSGTTGVAGDVTATKR